MTVVFDIDGTLTLVGNRVEELEKTPKDWDAFYERCGEDDPNYPIVRILSDMKYSGNRIILLTGRRESVRFQTEEWILGQGIHVGDLLLLMQKDGDFRHDTIVKPELLKEAGISLSDIDLVFEDRNSMVKFWRDNGVTCAQVAEGNF